MLDFTCYYLKTALPVINCILLYNRHHGTKIRQYMVHSFMWKNRKGKQLIVDLVTMRNQFSPRLPLSFCSIIHNESFPPESLQDGCCSLICNIEFPERKGEEGRKGKKGTEFLSHILLRNFLNRTTQHFAQTVWPELSLQLYHTNLQRELEKWHLFNGGIAMLNKIRNLWLRRKRRMKDSVGST